MSQPEPFTDDYGSIGAFMIRNISAGRTFEQGVARGLPDTPEMRRRWKNMEKDLANMKERGVGVDTIFD